LKLTKVDGNAAPPFNVAVHVIATPSGSVQLGAVFTEIISPTLKTYVAITGE
jgi:hypothetical protein